MRNNITLIRRKKKMTQKQLGELVGLSQAAICNYENGYRKLDFDTAKKISVALECSLDKLWHG